MRIFECRFKTRSVSIPFDCTATVIKMQMGKEHICDFIHAKAKFVEVWFKTVLVREIVVREKLFVLLVSDSGINEDQSVAIFN